MKLKLLLFSGFMLMILDYINAQDYKLAGISFLNYPNRGLKDETKNAEFSVREYGAFINIPYKLKNGKTVLINSLGYGWINITGKDFLVEHYQFNEQLQVMYYQIMFAHKLKNNWRIVAHIRPTIASDVEEKLSSDDFVLLGAAFVSKKVNEHFSIGGGLVYTSSFGKPFAVPVIPLKYKINKHSISALFPIRLIYKYSIDEKEKLKIGIKQSINGAQFNIAVSDTAQYNVPQFDKIRYTRVNLGGTINYNITKLIQFEANAGFSVLRRYRFLDSLGDTHKFDLKVSPFIQLGIALVYPK